MTLLLRFSILACISALGAFPFILIGGAILVAGGWVSTLEVFWVLKTSGLVGLGSAGMALLLWQRV